MTRIKIKKLVWDEWNIKHIEKHNATVREAEEAVKNFITHIKGKNGRYIAMGRSGTRLMSLVVRRISAGVYYPVSVRDSSRKERKEIYEKEKV
ncbi:hypothetical protein A3C59_00700 [Candidatus Daviesbacteria bacterium RIFCSPHIGHO2_02_FULL_36_13]|uniref:BrnT family toxin n=1 Tax=Candidatus Daviesbacteria bacterium RIFCSPHIGHO2_02_FULL_36_13 TaxID=1797768 RepID=A0A1F5JZA4_9BACT|nr:MAG: hypothetical protein A3C59_00700 [Candidatus Daviesbacteria bacterium RIFCSPHIGHO2_02_FULL_36_13]OGE41574.1 MAG: hypothetical protein A3A45_03055 [Candidatus Daviesbacteria bacterium RIFCSPLOWO2_01_FULL_36_8]